jgi:threonine dehydrogenase-like Zn-dependent dehydrogenase
MFGLSQKHIHGHLGYENSDIETLAKLVSCGRLDLSRSISRVVSLEDLPAGIAALERGDGNPIRILVQP